MNIGTRTLAKSSAAYLASIAFPIVWLLSTWVGTHWTTAITRGVLASVAVYFFGRLLLYPLVDTLLSAISEAERRRQEAEE